LNIANENKYYYAMTNLEAVAASSVTMIIGLICFVKGYEVFKRYRFIRDIPTSTIRSIAMGIVEIQGKVKPIKLFTAPYSGTDCVYVRYLVEELRQGRKSSHWNTISSGELRTPFIAHDRTGEVLVDPAEAEFQIDISREYKQDVGFLEGLWSMFESAEEKSANVSPDHLEPVDPGDITFYTNGDRRFREYYVLPGEDIYILGTATKDAGNAHETVIRKGTNEPTFVIGDKPETDMLRSLKRSMWLNTALSIVLIVASLFIILRHAGQI
jgi:Ca2+/Na+ antiporter